MYIKLICSRLFGVNSQPAAVDTFVNKFDVKRNFIARYAASFSLLPAVELFIYFSN